MGVDIFLMKEYIRGIGIRNTELKWNIILQKLIIFEKKKFLNWTKIMKNSKVIEIFFFFLKKAIY